MKKENRLTGILRRICLSLVLTTGLVAFFGCGGGGGGGSTTLVAFGTGSIDVDFGNVVLDHFKVQTITLQNNGNTTGYLGQIDPTQLDGTPFSIVSDHCSNAQVAPSKSCSLEVKFAPTSSPDQGQGPYTAAFIIPGQTGAAARDVSLSGNALALKVAINQVDTVNCPATIKLYVSVTDRYDNPVTGLTQADFTLYENNALIDEYPLDPDQKFTNLTSPLTTPLSVALVLDDSGSVQGVIDDLKAAAKSFVDQLSLDPDPDPDEAEIIKFASSVMAMTAPSGFISNPVALKAAIDADPNMGQGTQLYDAVFTAIEDTFNRNNRRAVVLFSDGTDTASVGYDLHAVIDQALLRGVPVFTIGLGNMSTSVLNDLGDETGGQYFIAPTSNNLTEVYTQVASLLSNQYLIEYSTASCGGGTTTLDVAVDLPNGDRGEGSITVDLP